MRVCDKEEKKCVCELGDLRGNLGNKTKNLIWWSAPNDYQEKHRQPEDRSLWVLLLLGFSAS